MQSRRRTDDPDAQNERVALKLAPFAAAATLAAVVALLGTTVDWGLYATAVVLGILAGLVRLMPWQQALGGTKEIFPSLIFLLAVAFMRTAAGGANSGIAAVALLPVFWTALHGDRRQLFFVTLVEAFFFLAALLFVGPPEYPHSQYRAAVLFVTVSAIIGFTTQRLVAEIRFQAHEAALRERALERVAAVMRGLSNSAHARSEVCEAAKTISSASFAVLYEPTGAPGTLRSTAIAGVEVAPLEVNRDSTSTAREAFVFQRSILWTEDQPMDNLNREMWEAVGRPASLLFEPVFGATGPVGVLVVGWDQKIGAGGARATMVALLAHEIAVAIERGDLLSQLADMASTDALTGLPNRRTWDKSLSHALVTQEPFALAMLDFDHFKSFNDTRGHPAGDRLLKETAAGWREELRAGDILARIGGEEFALLLPGCASEDALVVVERLRRRIPEEQTCSAGVVIYEPGESAEILMGRVDKALYTAKASGRDRVLVAA
ncbi:MAG TPA: sensor domain-containing diguanylate cyclase [Solirubrobacteraceae bacterium]|jgi:diguanylate cyclase (GGDEF)-like protein